MAKFYPLVSKMLSVHGSESSKVSNHTSSNQNVSSQVFVLLGKDDGLLLPSSLLSSEPSNQLLGSVKLGFAISDLLAELLLLVLGFLQVELEAIDLVLDKLEFVLLNLEVSGNALVLLFSNSQGFLLGLHN